MIGEVAHPQLSEVDAKNDLDMVIEIIQWSHIGVTPIKMIVQ
jgi:hypothetical protein